MNQEKETMQKVTSAGEYLAPSVKVKEFRERRVLCASFTSNGINSMEEDTEEGI